MNIQTQFQSIMKLVLPEVLVENFDLVSVEEHKDAFTLHLDEKLNRVPEHFVGYPHKLLGFMSSLTLQTFPAHGKAVNVCIRRRKWLRKDTQEIAYNRYDLYYPGVKALKPFSDFLKEAHGLTPDEFSELRADIMHP